AHYRGVGGEGGVGQPTCAAARAGAAADSGRRVLIVSTAPAHSLLDVLNLGGPLRLPPGSHQLGGPLRLPPGSHQLGGPLRLPPKPPSTRGVRPSFPPKPPSTRGARPSSPPSRRSLLRFPTGRGGLRAGELDGD